MYIFADKASTNTELNGVMVSIDPSGTLAAMKTAIVNATITEANSYGFNLIATDITMPSFMKGG